MKPELDSIDLRILSELHRNARLNHQELADLVGLSASPCVRRMKRLEAEGYIRGYTARIDETKLGYNLNAFVSVRLDRQVENRLVSFEKAIRVRTEVVDCWLMTGAFDYLLRVVVRDLADFEHFLTAHLTKSIASQHWKLLFPYAVFVIRVRVLFNWLMPCMDWPSQTGSVDCLKVKEEPFDKTGSHLLSQTDFEPFS